MHPSKRFDGMFVISSAKVTETQPLKAFLPIEINGDEIIIFVNDEHPLKAFDPIEVT